MTERYSQDHDELRLAVCCSTRAALSGPSSDSDLKHERCIDDACMPQLQHIVAVFIIYQQMAAQTKSRCAATGNYIAVYYRLNTGGRLGSASLLCCHSDDQLVRRSRSVIPTFFMQVGVN